MTTTTTTAHTIVCQLCGTDSDPFATRPEAAQLARIHDALWHGGAPTATVRPGAYDNVLGRS